MGRAKQEEEKEEEREEKMKPLKDISLWEKDLQKWTRRMQRAVRKRDFKKAENAATEIFGILTELNNPLYALRGLASRLESEIHKPDYDEEDVHQAIKNMVWIRNNLEVGE